MSKYTKKDTINCIKLIDKSMFEGVFPLNKIIRLSEFCTIEVNHINRTEQIVVLEIMAN